MLVECQNCGAPLKADGSQMFVDCQYCGRSNKVASSKTIMAQVPVDWRPPAQWNPSTQGKAAASVAAASVGASAGLGGCITATVAVVILLVGGVVAFSVHQASSGGPIFGPAWDGEAPFRCGGNDEIRIEGVTANLPGQTAVTADLNCEVTIVDSEITAATGIDASGNGTIRLENTTIHASGTGIRAALNKNIVLQQSVVIADGVGVEAGINSDVTITGGRVQGSPRAIQMGHNGDLNNQGGELIDVP